jgi:epoxyqueuosine reductase QueG
MNEEVFAQVFGKSPLMRAGYAKWQENRSAARRAVPEKGRANENRTAGQG